jgi:prepilin-type N-terminal cleavage/methylation domain-containing protein
MSKRKTPESNTHDLTSGAPPTTSSHGFTLVEIAVVAMIIGILAGIAIPQFSKIVATARQTQAEADLEMLSASILQLAWDTGKWPNGHVRNQYVSNPLEVPYPYSSIYDLEHDKSGLLGNNGTYFDTNKWAGPYIGDIPLDPWDRKYIFDSDYRIDGVWHIAVYSGGPNRSGVNIYDSDNIVYDFGLAPTP